MMSKNRTNASQRGFSLVEVLIALVIMSVGMLGIASLYVQAMQAGRTSLFRHNAVTLAGDVADRIRANPTAGAAYAVGGPGADNDCVDGTTVCTPAQMAAEDIFIWVREVQEMLPGGTVVVTFDNAPNPSEYTITINWTEPGPVPNPSYTVVVPVIGA